MKRTIFLSLAFLLLGGTVIFAQKAKVQFINNSPGKDLKLMDIYIDSRKVSDDLPYREASKFMSVNVSRNASIKIGAYDMHCADCSLFKQRAAFEANKSYIVVIDGLESKDGHTPFKGVKIKILETGREKARNNANTDILVHHGATDAPEKVDIKKAGQTAVDDLEYGKFSEYLEVPTQDFTFDLATADGEVISTYNAPLKELKLEGAAITIVASGFIDPSKNNNGPEFGLWVALPKGGKLIKLEKSLSTDTFALTNVSVYPNPASSEFSINLEDYKNTKAHVIDMLGRTLKTANLSGKSTTINVSNLSSGVYFVQLQKGNSLSKALKIQVK